MTPRLQFILGCLLGLTSFWFVPRGEPPQQFTPSVQDPVIPPLPPAPGQTGGSGGVGLSGLDAWRDALSALNAAAGDDARTLEVLARHVRLWSYDTPWRQFVGRTALRLYQTQGMAGLTPFLTANSTFASIVVAELCKSNALVLSGDDINAIAAVGLPDYITCLALEKLPASADLSAQLGSLPVSEFTRSNLCKELVDRAVRGDGLDSNRFSEVLTFARDHFGMTRMRGMLVNAPFSDPTHARVALTLLGTPPPKDGLTIDLARAALNDAGNNRHDVLDRLSPSQRPTLEIEWAGALLAHTPSMALPNLDGLNGPRAWRDLFDSFSSNFSERSAGERVDLTGALAFNSAPARSASVDRILNGRLLAGRDSEDFITALPAMEPWLARKVVLTLAEQERWTNDPVPPDTIARLGATAPELHALFLRHRPAP